MSSGCCPCAASLLVVVNNNNNKKSQSNLGAAALLPLVADSLIAAMHNHSPYLLGSASVHDELMHDSSGAHESMTIPARMCLSVIIKTSLSKAVGPIVL